MLARVSTSTRGAAMPAPAPVEDALNAQLGRELEAHLQYLAISSYFHAEGLPELARFFGLQASEEHDHALRFLTYLQDIDARVSIPALAAPRAGFESAEEAVALSLEWERNVSAHIHELVDLSVRSKDHPTQVFLQWFITEQVEEVATMSELLAVVRRAGERNLLMVEDYLARSARAPAGPAPAD
jgi:bacterioferritin B